MPRTAPPASAAARVLAIFDCVARVNLILTSSGALRAIDYACTETGRCFAWLRHDRTAGPHTVLKAYPETGLVMAPTSDGLFRRPEIPGEKADSAEVPD